jgi:hypothetical protein
MPVFLGIGLRSFESSGLESVRFLIFVRVLPVAGKRVTLRRDAHEAVSVPLSHVQIPRNSSCCGSGNLPPESPVGPSQ